MSRSPGAPLRIVYLTDAWTSWGGAERMLFSLVTGIDRERFDVTVFALFGSRRTNEDYLERVAAQGIATRHFALSVALRPRWLREFVRLVGALRAGHFVLAHCSGDRGVGGLAARLAGIRERVYTVHDMRPERAFGGRLAARFALRHLHTHIVAVSAAVADRLVAVFGVPPAKLSVIANAVDVPDVAAHESESADGEHHLVCVARLVEEKGVDIVVRSLARVRPSVPDADLVVVGDGPCRASLERLARDEGVSDCIRFVGQQATVGPWLEACDLFVLASRQEGLGIAALEAMAAGLPVVAAATGGLIEIVDDGVTGLIVPCRGRGFMGPEVSPDDLAEAIVALMLDSERCREMGHAARARVALAYSSAGFVESHERLYAGIVGTHQG